MNTFRKLISILLLCPLATGVQSCFTGIESTPKISYKGDKKADGAVSAEKMIAAEFTPQPVGEWAPGKQFFVTSGRASLVLSGAGELSPGDILAYAGQTSRKSVTGSTATDILFVKADAPANTLVWRAPEAPTPALPFLIEMDVIRQMRQLLVGNRYYLTTSLWYDASGNLTGGIKYVPVRITGVQPYSAEFPAIVEFVTDGDSATAVTGHVLMSENRPNATRAFDTMFSAENPRRRFPQTTDANWHAIQRSQTREGMTRAEVRASIGTPATIDRGQNQSAAFERWHYTDGVSLVFVDGVLSSEVR